MPKKKHRGTLGAPGVGNEKNTSSQVWPGPGASNLDQFITTYAEVIDKRMFHADYLLNGFNDFARPNLYKIEFIYPTMFRNTYSFLSDESRIMTEMTAKTVNIPSFDIGKQEIRRCGQRMFIPTSQNLGDLQMTLMCDDEYTQRKFLHSWLKHIVYDTDNNFYHKVTTSQLCKLVIRQFDNQFNTIFAAEFNGAWPHAIGEIQLSQDSDGQIVEFPATFCYSTYQILTDGPD